MLSSSCFTVFIGQVTCFREFRWFSALQNELQVFFPFIGHGKYEYMKNEIDWTINDIYRGDVPSTNMSDVVLILLNINCIGYDVKVLLCGQFISPKRFASFYPVTALRKIICVMDKRSIMPSSFVNLKACSGTLRSLANAHYRSYPIGQRL